MLMLLHHSGASSFSSFHRKKALFLGHLLYLTKSPPSDPLRQPSLEYCPDCIFSEGDGVCVSGVGARKGVHRAS